MAGHLALGGILKSVPAKYKPIAIGGIVGLPLGLFLLWRSHSSKTSSTPKQATGTQTLNANGVAIPVGGPEHTITKWIHTTSRGARWGNYNKLQGQISHLNQAKGFENKWLAYYRKIGNKVRVAQILKRLSFQNHELQQLHREAHAAWVKAHNQNHKTS